MIDEVFGIVLEEVLFVFLNFWDVVGVKLFGLNVVWIEWVMLEVMVLVCVESEFVVLFILFKVICI